MNKHVRYYGIANIADLAIAKIAEYCVFGEDYRQISILVAQEILKRFADEGAEE